MNIRRYDVTD